MTSTLLAVPPMTAAAAVLAVLCLVQIVLLTKLVRSSRTTADATTRVAQLTAALELLTDTTEEGFVNVASELERLGARPTAAGATRRATTRRIATAARRGTPVEDIAVAESLSESEVRLHLGLEAAATAASAATEIVPTPAAEAPGVLDDIERWMNSLTRARRPRSPRHAAVRV